MVEDAFGVIECRLTLETATVVIVIKHFSFHNTLGCKPTGFSNKPWMLSVDAD